MVDHGKIYLSEHLMSACARLGISVQPARVYQATDKAALERFFRTLGERLLAALPGYKGPDVYSRGKDPEQEAFYYLSELERSSATGPRSAITGSRMTGCASRGARAGDEPLEMFAHGIARAGLIAGPGAGRPRAGLPGRSSGAPSSTTGSRSAGCATTARR